MRRWTIHRRFSISAVSAGLNNHARATVNNMKLLYVTDRLSHHGGAPRHLLDIIKTMSSRHTVTVAASAKDSEVTLPEEVQFVRIPGLRSTGTESGKIEKLHPLMEASDLIHIQNIMNPSTMVATNTHRTIVTVQDHRVFCPGPGKTLPSGHACTEQMSASHCSESLPDETYRNRMIDVTQQRLDALRGANVVITLSEYMANELRTLNIANVHVLPPPVETSTSPITEGHGFLIAGRLVQHKGTTLAHKAWLDSGTDHPLRVAGLGSESIHLDGSQALGWLDRATLRRTLRQSRALLFPSRWQEPFGIIGVEALAVGTPVIAMLRGGMFDWADAGVIPIQPGNVQGMSDAISLLTDEPNTAIKLGRAGKTHVASMFKTEDLMNKLDQLYESTC